MRDRSRRSRPCWRARANDRGCASHSSRKGLTAIERWERYVLHLIKAAYANGDSGGDVPRGRPLGRASEARYFLADFLGFLAFFFGVNGCGGVFSIRSSTSSVRRWSASARGSGFFGVTENIQDRLTIGGH
jgi:hypothetical protein